MKTHAIILAGGKGHRLGGKDKGLELYNGQRLIDFAVAAIRDSVDSICISCNRNSGAYQDLGYAVYADAPDPNSFLGPISGIISCAMQMAIAEDDQILVIPCDTPELRSDFAKTLMSAIEAQDLAVAFDGEHIHNLHLLMRAKMLTSLNEFFDQGNRSIKYWLTQQQALQVDFSETKAQFKNLNRINDFSE